MARSRLKRIVDAGENGDAFAAIADVDVADDERLRQTTNTEAAHCVQVGKRNRARPVKHTAQIDKRRQFEIDVRRDGIDAGHLLAQLRAGGERVAVIEAPGTKAAQRLTAADGAL